MSAEVPMIDRRVHETVHELRLDRPPVNALSPDLLDAIQEEVNEAPRRGARALILSGREGLFSAGLDLPVLLALGERELGGALDSFFGAMETLAASPLPIAAAITGHCPAGGAVLSLFCDWRVMAEGEFTIGLNEVRIGIPMPDVVCALAARVVGQRRGEALCVSGRLMTPTEALEVGFVDQLVPVEKVVESARLWCENIIGSPGFAMSETRARMRRDLIELIHRHRAADTQRLAEEWFRPEVQASLHALVASLKGK
jgi:enoyl-CoA hydratase/carnithine racemase